MFYADRYCRDSAHIPGENTMRRWVRILLLCATASGFSMFASAREAWALAGRLDKPSIVIPTTGDGELRQQDPVCTAMHKVLSDHAKQFVSGSFINAHSTMEFGGSTADLNALLKDLAGVEGAKLQIRFAKSSDDPARMQLDDVDGPLPYQWRIHHSAWVGDPQSLSITVYLGDGKIQAEDVELPTILGKQPTVKIAPEFKTATEAPAEKMP
jgi:hypothetical protein